MQKRADERIEGREGGEMEYSDSSAVQEDPGISAFVKLQQYLVDVNIWYWYYISHDKQTHIEIILSQP